MALHQKGPQNLKKVGGEKKTSYIYIYIIYYIYIYILYYGIIGDGHFSRNSSAI